MSEGHNSRTISLIGYYNHFLKMPALDLHAGNGARNLPLSFQTSSRASKVFKTEFKYFSLKFSTKEYTKTSLILKLEK